MLRSAAIALILLPIAAVAQEKPKAQPDRTKVLDAMAKTPFFTAKGADAVKRVVAGGQVRNEDEKLLDPVPQPAKVLPGGPLPGPQAPGLPMPGQGQPPQPAPERPFTWRLIGISVGKRSGMALFQADGKSITVVSGSTLDGDTKVLSVDKRRVVLLFHGKKLALSPW